MKNLVILIGRLGKDPETKQLAGTTLCTFTLCTSEKYKNKQGEKVEDTTWHNIEIWGKLADVAGQYLKKGSLVSIDGKIKMDTYEKDGEKRTATKIRVDNFKMLGGPEQAHQSKPEQSHTPKKEYVHPQEPEDEIDNLPF